MKRLFQIILCLPLVLAAGCQKETSEQGEKGGEFDEERIVHINASLSGPTNATKAIVQGTDIPNKFSYGMFVCTHGSYGKHKENSWNLKATYTAVEGSSAGTWSYQYVNNFTTGSLTPNLYENVTITVKDNPTNPGVPVTADIYAYAPYIQEAFSGTPEAIPFTIADDISNQADLMYAVQNATDDNKDLNPCSTDEIPLEANFTFNHALALLAFEFEILNDNTNYRLRKIEVSKKNAVTAHLYKSGSFNAVTGKFNEGGDDVSSLIIKQPGTMIAPKEGTDMVAYMTLVPTPITEDDELVITFFMNDSDSDAMALKPFVLKKAYVRHGDSDVYGFQGGYKYTFKFTLDNYLYLEGFSVQEWDEEIKTLESIEI